MRFSLDSKRGEPTATPVPTKVADDITDMHGIGTEAGDLSSIAHLTITERSIIQMHIKHQDNPEFAVEFEMPSGKTITYKAMPGPGPGLDSIAMPTLPGPTTFGFRRACLVRIVFKNGQRSYILRAQKPQ